jgi:hypothetical protein
MRIGAKKGNRLGSPRLDAYIDSDIEVPEGLAEQGKKKMGSK